MATHATTPTRPGTRDRARGHHGPSALAWAVPSALGVIVGFWAFFINRDGGATTGGQIWLGIASGVAFAVLCHALVRVRWALPRELRAAAFGALTGATVGFLSSLNGNSVLESSAIGLALAAGMSCVMFYLYYTRED
ncbi:hypothetical protein [Streptomyces sp. ALB3]|uniref:hypothetical protein n=1 Tax=Streptomyces sp. ALB3 TaxID=3374278 RepID=UPI0037A83ABB